MAYELITRFPEETIKLIIREGIDESLLKHITQHVDDIEILLSESFSFEDSMKQLEKLVQATNAETLTLLIPVSLFDSFKESIKIEYELTEIGNNAAQVFVTYNLKNRTLSSINNSNMIKWYQIERYESLEEYITGTVNRTIYKEMKQYRSQLGWANAKIERYESKVQAGIREDEAAKYNDLMNKYKDTLKRLNNLRNSRLGKLQIKYWDLKG
ncbi:hypothetical protein [Macrococcoides canis]|uniref:DUF4391 family protein n=1 Tax=Macrococcoides canis TaxID=1855823 RepID=A0A1W7AAE0_9STAP|nr:hypothetical protein [Macrococcus canis]ARQ06528.1 hypothetical protein MCCS_08810 [Macrococcus canis]WBF52139.1 hypothetical protein LL975_08515 [Macrococcus canis]